MDSFFARNRLSSYLDGTLSESEAAEVSEAIDRDPSLRDEYENLQQAVRFIKQVGPGEAPEGFKARLMDVVAEEPSPGGSLAWLRRPLARLPIETIGIAAAAALVLVFVSKPSFLEPSPAVDLQVEDAKREGQLKQVPDLKQEPPPKQETAQNMQPADGSGEPALVGDRLDTPKKQSPSKTGSSGPALSKTTLSKKGGDQGKPISKPTKTQYDGDNPFVSEWEQADQAGGNELPQGVAVQTAQYAYGLRVSGAKGLADLTLQVDKAGGRLLDSMGQTIDPATVAEGLLPGAIRVVVPPGNSEAIMAILKKHGATAKTRPSSTALFASDYIVFDVDLAYD